ncbi:MAG TPA: DUF2892 domain-containing protein [Gemmatimonadaceae bacterium]|jgi:hypothetical protein|nr:DUF2892 domain-containing protein [Gemmatimonadaceae bacterium]
MKQNMGDADRTIRMLLGGALAILFFVAAHDGTAGAIVGGISVILFISALTGWSVIYFLLRISTRSDKDAKPLERS